MRVSPAGVFGVILAFLAGTVPATGAGATTVTFPLLVDHPVLEAALARALGVADGSEAVLWGDAGGCRFLAVRAVRSDTGGERVRIRLRGRARVGFRLLWFCIGPSWDGSVETTARPEVGRDFQLRLRDLDSALLDETGRASGAAGWLWGIAREHVEERFEGFAFDLGPPVDEARALVRACAPPERAGPVLAALDTLRPLGTSVGANGVAVDVAIDVPPGPAEPAPPEPALTPEEAVRWQAALERWDGFLVFVVKQLGVADQDPGVRGDLFDLLLASRQRLLEALVSPPRGGVDPVRQLFLDAWSNLREIVRRSMRHGGVHDHALGWASFLAAGDALSALEAAAPGLGLDISAGGLRRLARLVGPDVAGDPLAYSEDVDPTLRDLFGFHEPEGTEPPPPPEPQSWWWRWPRSAHAAAPGAEELDRLGRRLDRWVPRAEERDAYREAVARLLAVVGERSARTDAIAPRFHHLWALLVPTVAWQESCWRQFVLKRGRVVPLVSASGDVGIMQVNRRVWRGFFDLQKLAWDIVYNAGAGCEILAQLLARYAAREAGSPLDAAARATYSAYNAGPDAYRRWRSGNVPAAERAIDEAFWTKYRAMATGTVRDEVLCL